MKEYKKHEIRVFSSLLRKEKVCELNSKKTVEWMELKEFYWVFCAFKGGEKKAWGVGMLKDY